MTNFEMFEKATTAEGFERLADCELAKYFGWIFVGGLAIGRAAMHYATSEKCRLVAALRQVKDVK